MKIEIGTNEAGQRLDKFLRKYFKDVPLSAIFKALRKGDIRVNGTKKKENYALELGDEIEVRYLQSKKESNSSKEVNFIKVNSGSMKVTYEDENILVVDAGRYGFVKLQYYKPPQGFEDAITFTDSKSMFENLWEEWFDTQLFLLAKGTPMAGMGYSEIFECLPKEKQKELTDRKAEFARVAGIE